MNQYTHVGLDEHQDSITATFEGESRDAEVVRLSGDLMKAGASFSVPAHQPLLYCRVGDWRRSHRCRVATLVYFRTRPQTRSTIPGFHSPLVKPCMKFSLTRLSCGKSGSARSAIP